MHHLFLYFIIRWSCRMAGLMLCYHSIAPCTYIGDIRASAICHLWRFIFSFSIKVGINRLSYAAVVTYPMALHFTFLHRGHSRRIGGN